MSPKFTHHIISLLWQLKHELAFQFAFFKYCKHLITHQGQTKAQI